MQSRLIGGINQLILIQIFFFGVLSAQEITQDSEDHGLNKLFDGLDKNLELKIENINNEILSNEFMSEQISKYLPALDFNSGIGKQFGRSVDPFTNEFTSFDILTDNLSLNYSFTLFGFGKVSNGISLSNLSLRLNTLSKYQKELELKKIISDLYFSLLATRVQLKYLRKTKAKLEEDSFNNSLFIKSGYRTVFDSLVTRENINENIGKINDLEALEINIISKLVILTNSELVESLTFELPDSAYYKRVTILANEIMSENILDIPQWIIDRSTIQNEIQRLEIKDKKLAFMPTLKLNGSVSTGFSNNRVLNEFVGIENRVIDIGSVESTGENVISSFEEQVFERVNYSRIAQYQDNLNYYIGLSLKIPLLIGFNLFKTNKEQKLNEKLVPLKNDIAKNNFINNIQDIRLRIKQLYVNIASIRDNLIIKENIYLSAFNLYNLNRLSLLELNRLLQDKRDKEIQFFKSVIELKSMCIRYKIERGEKVFH